MLAHFMAASVAWASLANMAPPKDPWLGAKVMPKENCQPRVGNRDVQLKLLPLPFVIREVSGDWLWTGRAWVRKSQVVPLDYAAAYYTEYLRNHPTSAWAYIDRGLAWQDKGELENALNDYTEAIRLDPKDSMAYNNRGTVWKRKGELDIALKDYTEAIRLDPRSAMAYTNRGNVWKKKGELDNALKDYTEAIRLDPAYAAAYNGFAWFLATAPDAKHRDGARAVRMATRACELSRWSKPNFIDTLAAAYAEDGDFDQAIKWQKKAMQLDHSDNDIQSGSQQRLKLYQDEQPYREE